MFITEEDLLTRIREDYLHQLTDGDNCIIETAIQDAITMIENKLDELYDFSELWKKEGDERNSIAVLLVKSIVLHILYERAPDDDTPTSVRDNYKWAMSTLDNGANGKPINLPKLTKGDASSEVITTRRWNSDQKRSHGMYTRKRAN